jgi:hypothetical protein
MIDDNAYLGIIAWAKKILAITDHQLLNSQIIVNTPWSSIIAIYTTYQTFYLKQTPKLIALEASIIKILRDYFHTSVPVIIAHNEELNCFLMQDSGRSLRSVLKNKFDPKLLCKAIEQFTLLQRSVADHIEVFLNIGVPDWRLNKFTDLYKEVISQKNLLIACGYAIVEIKELEMIIPRVTYLSAKLRNYGIKETIVQPDFSDNNTLIDPQSNNITIIDVREISISYPFFSLLNCLQQLQKHYGFTKNDPVYLEIQQACLKNYINCYGIKDVMGAFEVANKLWPIYRALAIYRLIQACGEEKLGLFHQEKLSKALKEFVVVCR